MTLTATRPRTRQLPSLRLRWLGVLLAGLGLFAGVLAVLLDAGDPLYVPSLLLLGSAVVPATFTTFVDEVSGPPRLSLGRIATAAVLGAVIGAVLAGEVEFETARALGGLPTAMIGLIEEFAKLAVPAVLLARRRARPVDGIVLGVAVGSGFAALETMGYAFVTLLRAHGHLAPVTDLLLLRAVTAPGGHAAWTGLACAALVAVHTARRRWLGWLRFLSVFAAVVVLHAVWDGTAQGFGHLGLAALSLAMLLTITWRVRRSAGPDPIRNREAPRCAPA